MIRIPCISIGWQGTLADSSFVADHGAAYASLFQRALEPCGSQSTRRSNEISREGFVPMFAERP